MSALFPPLLAVLKWLGLLLLILLALLLAALCVPAVVDIRYRQQKLRLMLHFGPLRCVLYPRPGTGHGREEAEGKTAGRGKKPGAGKKGAPGTGNKAARTPAPNEAAGTPGEAQGAPTAGRLQVLLDAARRDPLGMLQAVLAHVGFAGGRLLRGVHVRGLDVFWTVTAPQQDAAATALLYGRELATLNALLVAARQRMDIRADALWLEPDFTGERRAERSITARVTMRPLVLVVLAPRLLYRIWRDPAFKSIFTPQEGRKAA